MAEPLVIQADLELFLVGWYRRVLAARPEPVCQGVEVGNAEPADGEFPARMLVIHDVSGADTSFLTAHRDVYLSVLAGTQENPKDANDLARIVHALRSQIPAVEPGNPVAAVVSSRGPIPVPEEQPRARRLVVVTFSVVGAPL